MRIGSHSVPAVVGKALQSVGWVLGGTVGVASALGTAGGIVSRINEGLAIGIAGQGGAGGTAKAVNGSNVMTTRGARAGRIGGGDAEVRIGLREWRRRRVDIDLPAVTGAGVHSAAVVFSDAVERVNVVTEAAVGVLIRIPVEAPAAKVIVIFEGLRVGKGGLGQVRIR